MKIYLVGGAVRDSLLGIKPKDKDWVVVGASEDSMLNQGFIKVGSDFPVFLHPKTKEEYALARTERKISSGHTGFKTKYGKNITLKEDLARRDLTINSIAMDSMGNIIDPFDGLADIKNRVLRHTTNAFCEDPLRVIRLARFKAQLSNFGFSIANDTKLLAKKIITNGELSQLKQERLGIEFIKSLTNPNIFFSTLDELNCLNEVFPNINLSQIPCNDFYISKSYTTANIYSQIAMTLFQHSLDNIYLLKNELCLSNSTYKHAIALAIIARISSMNLSATQILENIKLSNLLRDKSLLETSIMNAKFIKDIELFRLNNKIENTLSTIKELTSINYKNLITNSNEAEKIVNNAKLDIIKKHFKI